MLSTQTIDFARGDSGLLIFFYIIPLIFILKGLDRAKDIKFVKKSSRRILFWNGLAGIGVAFIIFGLSRLGNLFGPQDFQRLQISNESITLVFPWPNPDRVIPLTSITDVSYKYVLRGKRPRSSTQVKIETAGETFLSFSFDKLSHEDFSRLQELQMKFGSN